MATHFHQLIIKEVRKETDACISVAFTIPESLEAEYVFLAGQNIVLRVTLHGKVLRRSYSICSAPHEKELRIAIKKVTGGLFSTWAYKNLKAGDEIEVMPPAGKFNTPLLPNHKKNYLAFAAGSGITPIFSIIKSTLVQEPNSQFTLVYANRNRRSIIFFEALEAIKNKYMQRFRLINILSQEKTSALLHFGRINHDKLAELSAIISYASIDETFICGPENMIFCVKDFLETYKIDKKQIHFELFAPPGKVKKLTAPAIEQREGGATSNINIQLDGHLFSFSLPPTSGTSILDAALQQGADLPFACKGGVCCSCKAKLLDGKVKMEVQWGLTPEEIKDGFILVCQAHPLSNTVLIDFDIK